ncbi:MAG: helix-turn-helix domain-containing protein [Methylobacillus sp.]|nr:helix-turn-helix domain-containing protein [Methylobacillus sp.]
MLREKRKEAGLSQEVLALDVGLERTFISMLERGQRQPSLTTMLKIAPALGCSASDLMAAIERLLNETKPKPSPSPRR